MTSITSVAEAFFTACETGKGWDVCRAVKSFATDAERKSVCAYGVFHGTHTGPGGPVPPTGRRTSTDYVYFMQFEGDTIVHMTKIWNAGLAMKDLGWA
jgi:hypothetical protein